MDLNSLDLNLIRVFDALWQERSVTRAGARIGLSQPAVSAALDRLRHALNDRLFVRRGNLMVPTPRAEDLAPRARAALEEIGRMLSPGRRFEAGLLARVFTLLGSDFFTMEFMPKLALALRHEAPGVRLRLLDSARGDVARSLQDSAIDMALEAPMAMPDWVSSALLFDAPFAVAVSRGHPAIAGLADRSVLPMEVFCGLDHVLRSVDGGMTGATDAALAGLGLSRRVTMTLPTFHAVAQAVAQGGHIAVMPVQYVRAVKDLLGLAEFRPPLDIAVPGIRLYWHSRNDGDPAHRWMRDLVIGTVGALGCREAAT